MTVLNDTTSIRNLLATRRSASPKAMGEPGPSPEQLEEILTAAVRVPDHGKLTPWRFILFEGAARGQFGERLRARWHELHPEHGPEMLDFAARMFLRAPAVVAVVSTAQEHPKIPVWEQTLSSAAVCQNMLIAATALGVGSSWNTDWLAYDGEIGKVMGLKPHEKIAGFIYLGTSTVALEDRPRPDPLSLLTTWQAQ
jgi:nitroreductase